VEQDVYKRANVKMIIPIEEALNAANKYYKNEMNQ
jgi:hypothetical protein